jgi:hypothetical protein
MYRTNADFVFTVTRDFVRSCQTPVLICTTTFPRTRTRSAMEAAMLAPKAQVRLYPWKERRNGFGLAIRHMRSFLPREPAA